jgi:hypothetical protein
MVTMSFKKKLAVYFSFVDLILLTIIGLLLLSYAIFDQATVISVLGIYYTVFDASDVVLFYIICPLISCLLIADGLIFFILYYRSSLHSYRQTKTIVFAFAFGGIFTTIISIVLLYENKYTKEKKRIYIDEHYRLLSRIYENYRLTTKNANLPNKAKITKLLLNSLEHSHSHNIRFPDSEIHKEISRKPEKISEQIQNLQKIYDNLSEMLSAADDK